MPMVKQPLTVEHALLGFLRQRPMYGYEIHQRLISTQELGLVWRIKQSLLYMLLARLEQEGYLSSTLEQQSARPPRKTLHITPAGARAFEEWVRSPVHHGRDFRLEFLAKLYFAREEGSAAAHELVGTQRAATAAQLVQLQSTAANLEAARSYDWLVARFRVGQLEATLAWLELCEHWLPSAEHRPEE